jgi:hypothetical protein
MCYVHEREELVELLEEAGCDGYGIPFEWDIEIVEGEEPKIDEVEGVMI